MKNLHITPSQNSIIPNIIDFENAKFFIYLKIIIHNNNLHNTQKFPQNHKSACVTLIQT